MTYMKYCVHCLVFYMTSVFITSSPREILRSSCANRHIHVIFSRGASGFHSVHSFFIFTYLQLAQEVLAHE